MFAETHCKHNLHRIVCNNHQNARRDWSMSSLAGYWAMQPRAHQAFYEIKSTCKEHCTGSSTAPERSSCLMRECFEPAQRRDRERAAAAGLTYEQMQTPLLMRAAYGAAQPKFVVMLRDPVERCAASLCTAWCVRCPGTLLHSLAYPFRARQSCAAPPLRCRARPARLPRRLCQRASEPQQHAFCRMHSAFHSYGHYWERYGGRTPAGFERFAAEQLAGFRNCTRAERHSPFTCALYMESLSQNLDDVFFHSDQLLRGLYSVWLHLWLSHFPRESFLVVKAEDYFARPRAVLQRVFEHLGTAPPSGEGWDAILGAASIRSAATGAEMTTAARQALDEFYAPFDADLAALLGDQTWRWRS